MPQRRAFLRVLDAFHQRSSPDDMLDLVRRTALQKGNGFEGSDNGRRSRSRSSSGSPVSRQGSRSDAGGSPNADAKKRSRSNSRASSGASEKHRLIDEVKRNEKMDDGDEADDETVGHCLVPGVTSRELELFMTALLYRAHKTISHTCTLLNR